MSRNIRNQLTELSYQDKVRRAYPDAAAYVLKRDHWLNLLRGGSAAHPSKVVYRSHQLRLLLLAQYAHEMKLNDAVIPSAIRKMMFEGALPPSLGLIDNPDGDQLLFDLISSVATLEVGGLPVTAANTIALLNFEQDLATVSDPWEGRPFTRSWQWKTGHTFTVFDSAIALKVIESKDNADALVLMTTQGQIDSSRAVQALESGVCAPMYSGAL